jgi:hypothetical protein
MGGCEPVLPRSMVFCTDHIVDRFRSRVHCDADADDVVRFIVDSRPIGLRNVKILRGRLRRMGFRWKGGVYLKYRIDGGRHVVFILKPSFRCGVGIVFVGITCFVAKGLFDDDESGHIVF